MTLDRFHVEMEDISMFLLERSVDYSLWEEISYDDLKENILADLPEEKQKLFFGVIRNGGTFKLNDYYYRVISD
ncbi:hypothetical protein UR09_02255 [Candidatus Nitromaritima sp. SCGC AAA799-A02]|nr:hypothetical protein UZ36_06520 [Candidatus Nitromaritima sp. SCGC AAA799-C22]KMP11910.1 hypothetical protein UR09_02255 [Candidatus Nitromaritima sp. SCGC AAA799-A02]